LGAAGETVGDTTFLVGDDGVKYRIPDAGALAALGYGGATPVRVPSTLLSMLPTGPELSARAAASDSGSVGGAMGGAAAQCGTGAGVGGRSGIEAGLPSDAGRAPAGGSLNSASGAGN
jgi:hypothetical protein